MTQTADTQEQAELTFREFTYDAESNTLTTTDAKGQSQSNVYDARNRRVQNTDRNTGLTTFAYDENSNLLTITDADANSGGTGKQTIYTYDPRNLKLTEALPGHTPGVSSAIRGMTWFFMLMTARYARALARIKRVMW